MEDWWNSQRLKQTSEGLLQSIFPRFWRLGWTKPSSKWQCQFTKYPTVVEVLLQPWKSLFCWGWLPARSFQSLHVTQWWHLANSSSGVFLWCFRPLEERALTCQNTAEVPNNAPSCTMVWTSSVQGWFSSSQSCFYSVSNWILSLLKTTAWNKKVQHCRQPLGSKNPLYFESGSVSYYTKITVSLLTFMKNFYCFPWSFHYM